MASPLTFDLFILIFAFGLLEVSHISSSGLFDLLTEKAYHTRRAISTKFKIDVTIHVAL